MTVIFLSLNRERKVAQKKETEIWRNLTERLDEQARKRMEPRHVKLRKWSYENVH